MTSLLLPGGPAQAQAAPQSEAASAARGICGDVRQRPWCDPRLTPDKRAGLVLARLTLEEKIALLGGDELFGVAGGEGSHTGTSDGVPRLGIPTLYFSDGPVGTRQGRATQMPSPMAVASSFSPATARVAGTVIADEARKKGNHVVFAPGVNIGRTPLNGRTFEYYGEDPYLAGQMGLGFIRGIQGQGVIANVKHYAVNNQEGEGYAVPGSPLGAGVEGNRLFVNAVVAERALREIYLPAFETAVKDAHVGTVMCSYNRVNGTYGCENEHLLVDILKGEWGFDGFVLTDYGAAKNALNSLNNGLDLDIWPGLVYDPLAVRALVATSQVSTATIDEHLRRILRTMFAYGIFDAPAFTDDASRIDVSAHHASAARVEAQGMVLLKNKKSLLPLQKRTVRTLAVIGPEADTIRTGGGSSDVKPLRRVTPLAGLRAAAGRRSRAVRRRLRRGPRRRGRASRRRGRGGRGRQDDRGVGQGGPDAELGPDRRHRPRCPRAGSGRGPAAHRRGPAERRAGADAVARPGACGARGVVPGPERRDGAREGALRRPRARSGGCR